MATISNAYTGPEWKISCSSLSLRYSARWLRAAVQPSGRGAPRLRAGGDGAHQGSGARRHRVALRARPLCQPPDGRGPRAPAVCGLRVLAAADGGRRAVAEITAGTPGRLTRRGAGGLAAPAPPAVLHQFRDAHRRLSCPRRSGHSEEVLEMVRRAGRWRSARMRPIPGTEVPPRRRSTITSCRSSCIAGTGSPPGRSAQRAARRAPHPLRPDEQLPRAHVEHVPAGRDRPARLPRGRQHRRRQAAWWSSGSGLRCCRQHRSLLRSCPGRLFPVVVADMAPVRRQIVCGAAAGRRADTHRRGFLRT